MKTVNSLKTFYKNTRFGPTLSDASLKDKVRVFVVDKLFISTRLGGTLKISNIITCLYGTVLEIYFFYFMQSQLEIIYLKNTLPPPPLNGGPLKITVQCMSWTFAKIMPRMSWSFSTWYAKYVISTDLYNIPIMSDRYTQQSWDICPMLVWCWATVFDAGPTSNQHWVNVSCLIGNRFRLTLSVRILGGYGWHPQ